MKRFRLLIVVTILLILAALALYIRPSYASRAGGQQVDPSTDMTAISEAAVAAGSVFSYQGQLTNAAGNPITNPSLPMIFRLFTVQTGGTACWTESQNVNVQNGQFNILLGKTTTIPATCLEGNTYLEIVVNNEILNPREFLASVPYAIQANTLPANAKVGMSLNVAGDIIAGVSGNEFLIHTRNSNNGDFLQITSKDPGSDWKFNQGITLVDSNGNVGIGTRSPQERLDVSGNAIIGGNLSATGSTICNGNGTCLSGTDVFVGGQYALHAQPEADTLHLLPFANGLYDRVCIGCGVTGRGLIVRGGLEIHGSCTQVANRLDGEMIDDAHCEPGSITSGAYVEANLMTPEERSAESLDHFERGDLLCWSANEQQLELCSQENDRLVMAVADANGKPIVLGAEPVKVIGPVVAGDLLVASSVPGYAMVNNEPLPGTVIGQALEDLDGERGIIKAMIRKW
jgi:hypothetical protein